MNTSNILYKYSVCIAYIIEDTLWITPLIDTHYLWDSQLKASYDEYKRVRCTKR